MASLEKIQRASVAPSTSAVVPARHLAIELAETLKLAVPIALTQLGQIAMMTTDLAMIGRLGAEAVAAALEKEGVAAKTITVVGKGETYGDSIKLFEDNEQDRSVKITLTK